MNCSKLHEVNEVTFMYNFLCFLNLPFLFLNRIMELLYEVIPAGNLLILFNSEFWLKHGFLFDINDRYSALRNLSAFYSIKNVLGFQSPLLVCTIHSKKFFKGNETIEIPAPG